MVILVLRPLPLAPRDKGEWLLPPPLLLRPFTHRMMMMMGARVSDAEEQEEEDADANSDSAKSEKYQLCAGGKTPPSQSPPLYLGSFHS